MQLKQVILIIGALALGCYVLFSSLGRALDIEDKFTESINQQYMKGGENAPINQ